MNAEVYCQNEWTGEACYLYFGDDSMKTYQYNYYILKLDQKSATTRKIAKHNCDIQDKTKSCDFSTSGYGTTFKTEFKADTTKTISFLDNSRDTLSFDLSIDYRNYISYRNLVSGESQQNSGAYIFRTDNSTMAGPKSYSNITGISLYSEGDLMSIARFEGTTVNSTILFNKFEDSDAENGIMMSIEAEVGPLDTSDGNGKEVVQIITHSKIKNNKTWYTDSNGLDFQKRVWNFQPTYQMDPDQNDIIPSNYYPVNAAIYIQDDKQARMTLLVDRSEGGTSRANGQIETMLHRKTLIDTNGNDDNRGVVENLDEKGPDGLPLRIKPLFNLIIERPGNTSQYMSKVRVNRIDYMPQIMFGDLRHGIYFDGFVNTDIGWSVKVDSLPEALKVFMSYQTNDDYYLLRLHNLSETKVSVSHDQLLEVFKLGSGVKSMDFELTEMALSNLETLNVMQKRKIDWVSKLKGYSRMLDRSHSVMDSVVFFVEVEKWDVRTFRMKVMSEVKSASF